MPALALVVPIVYIRDMAICAYIRVSSRSQTLDSQQDAIHRAALARGDRITRWYCETMTGAKTDRPERVSLLDDARGGSVTVLWVYRLDRLSRAGIRDTVNCIEELKVCGCQVKTVADGFSIDGPAADIILAVLAWAAQMERQAISDRVAAARVRVESRGGTWGRPGRLTGSETRKINELRAQGLSIRDIAQEVRVPRSVVQRLTRKKVIGSLDDCPESASIGTCGPERPQESELPCQLPARPNPRKK
jgi:DNA invertase Pin-like site-specific DNA recombinase